MSGLRRAAALAGAAGVAALLVPAVRELPAVGSRIADYGLAVNELGAPLQRVTNLTTAVNFAFRALDTLGEEFVLFTAVCAVAVLLRETRAGEDRPEEANLDVERPPAAQWVAPLQVGLLAAVGSSLALYGHLSPGGGFQGGVLLAGALLMLYLGVGFGAFSRVARPRLLEALECAGVAGYVAVGLAGLAGGSFLANVLPLGTTGSLLSGGAVPVLDVLVALAVGAGLGAIFMEFLQEVVTEGGDEG